MPYSLYNFLGIVFNEKLLVSSDSLVRAADPYPNKPPFLRRIAQFSAHIFEFRPELLFGFRQFAPIPVANIFAVHRAILVNFLQSLADFRNLSNHRQNSKMIRIIVRIINDNESAYYANFANQLQQFDDIFLQFVDPLLIVDFCLLECLQKFVNLLLLLF